MKLCKKCNKNKLLSDFHKTKKNKDGLYPYCKSCTIADVTLRGIKNRNTLIGYLKYLAASSKSNAKKRNIKYKLSYDDIHLLYTTQNGLCAITKEQLTYSSQQLLTNISLDRIDSTKAYTLDNCQLVCYVINTMKWTLSLEELKKWCERILNG